VPRFNFGRTVGLARNILRAIVLVVILAVVAFVALGFIARAQPSAKEPTATEAPWVVKTSSRIYLAKELRLEGNTPEVKGYWTVDNGRYRFYDKVKVFSFSLYGHVDVIRRGQ
jgi:hypothetical protein